MSDRPTSCEECNLKASTTNCLFCDLAICEDCYGEHVDQCVTPYKKDKKLAQPPEPVNLQ